MARLALTIALLASLCAVPASVAGAAMLEPVGSFDQPISIVSDRVEPDRLFVAERPGRVDQVEGDGAEPRLYADLTGFVSCCAGERGLLSIALAPGFRTSGRFYAAYTGKPAAGGSEGDIHVDAFAADGTGRVTRTPIISIPHSLQANHNGGQIQFGPDGHLYISTGDGGGGGDPYETGQDLGSPLGKVLRIDPRPGFAVPYAIPPGNPFAGAVPGADEVWAYGLRNPWRFSFDSLGGDLLIADVGQGAREEVNLAHSPAPGVVGGAGANYGWSCREGFLAYSDATPAANCAGAGPFTDPIFDYPHLDPGAGKAHGCSITGGYVVRDASLGDLYGRYVYADYCVGEVRSLALPSATGPATGDRAEPLGAPTPNPTSFGEDSCHRLYVASGGNVFRFVGPSPADCSEAPGEEPAEEGPPEDESPGEGPPVLTPPMNPPLESASVLTRRRVTIRLLARGPNAFVIEVGVIPCRPAIEGSVQLRRGGKPLAGKPLDRDCRLRFLVEALGAPATFRAILLPTVEAGARFRFRTRRLRVDAAPRPYRSQVRKIALANPTP